MVAVLAAAAVGGGGDVVAVASGAALVASAAMLAATLRSIASASRPPAPAPASAARDGLTGLPTRDVLLGRLSELLEPAPADRRPAAVVFVDIDGLATVNATLGHDVGDVVVATLANRLSRCLAPGQLIARLGGDELAILVEEGGVAVAAVLADELLAAAREPLPTRDRDLSVSVSIGIAPVPDEACRLEEVLRLADQALVAAKRRGRDRREVALSAADRPPGPLERHVGLQRAVRNSELRLHYQPIVAVADGRAVGLEALLRWQHPTEGLLQAGAFLAGSADDALMVEIGSWVLSRACEDLASWPADAGEPPAWVSVNVAPAQLRWAFVHEVADALAATGLAGERLVIEVTEDAVVRDAVTGRDVLQRLRDLGCRVAIDDFGTGYSSLGYLLELPVDVLKLDRIFTRHLTDPSPGRELVAAIVGIGRALGARVVIEGVETAEQLCSVQLLGCDLAQGFYFARPTPISELHSALEPARS